MKRIITSSLLISISLVLSLVLAELTLRWQGSTPLQSVEPRRNPDMGQADSILGWKMAPGIRHELVGEAPYHQVTYTILADGNRATSAARVPDPSRPDIYLVGDSFTQGMAVNDNETYAWLLQDRNPSANILNYGVGGYGTLQSLLMLKQLASTHKHPKTFIYGFINEHESRNIASSIWVYTLVSFITKPVFLPYVKQYFPESNTLETGYRYLPVLPFHRSSALVSKLELLYVKYVSANLYEHNVQTFARQSTLALIQQMNDTSRTNGATFVVVILLADTGMQEEYTAALAAKGIRVINCNVDITAPGMSVPGEGHPSPLAHRRYAECINQAL